MLELAILGVLKEQPLHGYELKKRLVDTVGGAASAVSFGSLYPALGRLEAAGAVRTVAAPTAEAGPIPLTGSLGGELAAFRARTPATRAGRSRKVYAITARGETLFEELLAAEPAGGDEARAFTLRLAFARHLPADLRLRMLERRRAQLLERLTRVERGGRGRIDAYLRSLMDHDRETLEHDVAWIERLIAQERLVAGSAEEQPGSDPASDLPGGRPDPDSPGERPESVKERITP